MLLRNLFPLRFPDDAAGAAAAVADDSGKGADGGAGGEAAAGKKPDKEPDLTGVRQFAKAFMGQREAPETPEAKAAREAKEAEDKAKAEKEKAEKARRKPAKPAAAPAAVKPLTADQIAEAAARGTAAAMSQRTDKKPDDKGAGGTDTDADFDAAQKRKAAVLEHMEKLYPDKYKDVAKQYRTGQRKLSEYAAKWEEEHPGQSFDAEAEEHKDFFEKNGLFETWDEDDYTEALADMRAEKKMEAHDRKTSEKLSKLERLQKLTSPETLAAIDKEQVKAASLYWNAFGDDFKGILNEHGVVDTAKAKELRDKDPEFFDMRWHAAGALDAEVSELWKVMSGLVDYDAKNQAHQVLSVFASQKEQEMMKQPDEDRLDAKNRVFLPAAEYYKLPKDRREQDHWTFSAADLAALRAADLAKMTANLIKQEDEKFNRMAKARGLKLDGQRANGQPPAEEEAEPEPKPRQSKPASPGGGAESRLAAGKAGEGADAKNPLKTFASRFMGQR